ncbi:MAG: hypothetical protein CFE21_08160 [Bacteroidetes bacterium B1(2017)]|nr:MAG: hypothetical protein CFE21_08160 [Bacteroidetes bacterium B1(2017)]
MKKVTIIPLLVFLFSVLNTQAQSYDAFVKKVNETYLSIPNTQFCASMCECTNEDYQVFLAASPENKQYIYDSAGWNFSPYFKDAQVYNEPLTRVYYQHQAYKTFPVVNVSQESATAYCAWLTQVYNSNPNRKYKKVEFRLPTEKDWIQAATGNLPEPNEKKVFPWRGLTFKDKKGLYLANFASVGEYNIKRNASGQLIYDTLGFGSDLGSDGAIYSTRCVGNYPPNDFGLYHMAGNVSEYTSVTGQTKGGSYISPGHYLLLKSNDPEFPNMEKGGAFIGFRPFMYIQEK